MNHRLEKRTDRRGRECWVVLNPEGEVVNGVYHHRYSDADHQRKILDALRPWITKPRA